MEDCFKTFAVLTNYKSQNLFKFISKLNNQIQKSKDTAPDSMNLH